MPVVITMESPGCKVEEPAPGVKLLRFIDQETGIVVQVPLADGDAIRIANLLTGKAVVVPQAGGLIVPGK